jgi:hypothetical protein
MTIFTPIKPGQRRYAFAFGQSLVVKVVMKTTFEDGKWTCLTEPHSDPVFIAESEFGDVLPEHCEPEGLCHDRI